MIQIVLVDDHPLAINGIGAWLSSTGRFAIAGTAGTLAEARSLFERIEAMPEIVILDISLGPEDGLDLIPALKKVCTERAAPMPGILVCSVYEDPFLIQRALDLGAEAYVSKSAESGEIISAIDAILVGECYVNPKYHTGFRRKAWTVLSPRENEIVSLVKRSMSNAQIAKHLGLSARTIENHLAHIYVKADVASREELMKI